MPPHAHLAGVLGPPWLSPGGVDGPPTNPAAHRQSGNTAGRHSKQATTAQVPWGPLSDIQLASSCRQHPGRTTAPAHPQQGRSRVVRRLHEALARLVRAGVVVEGDERKAAVEGGVLLVHHQLDQLHTCRATHTQRRGQAAAAVRDCPPTAEYNSTTAARGRPNVRAAQRAA